MVQATIPSPPNSSSQSLDPWPEGKEWGLGPQVRALAVVFGELGSQRAFVLVLAEELFEKVSSLPTPHSTLHGTPALVIHRLFTNLTFHRDFLLGLYHLQLEGKVIFPNYKKY